MKLALMFALILQASIAYSAETPKAEKERTPASVGSLPLKSYDYTMKTQQVGNKTVVCGFASAQGDYSSGGGSNASAAVHCVVVDTQ